MRLTELAVKYEGTGFDITQEQFDAQVKEFKNPELVRHLSSSLSLLKINKYYFLKEYDKIISYCILSKIEIDHKEYLNLEFIAANPSIKSNNGLHLFWALCITLKDTILIGGAISNRGLKFIQDFFRRNNNSNISDYNVIDTKSGKINKVKNFEEFFKNFSYSLIIECWLTEDKHVGDTTLYIFERIE